MASTLVIQSYKKPISYSWLEKCVHSVKIWANLNQFEYRYLGDELFDYVPKELLEKTEQQRVIATDLARLKVIKKCLLQGYKTVIWCDADFLIFALEKFKLLNTPYALGREVWVQAEDGSQKLNSYTKVHNAFIMFRAGNSFLDFYLDTAERLLSLNQGTMPAQFIGPKLLTAIHNVVQCHILETAGMLSPLVIQNIADKKGPALDLFQKKSPHPILAANLCTSMYENGQVSETDMNRCIQVLLESEQL